MVKADEYSDLDVVIATKKPEGWLYGDYPEKLGIVKISFVEATLGGGKERRTLYDGSLDVENYLLKMIEMYSVSKYKVDVWHDGRLLDRWAEREILSDLEKCFAHYNREDMVSALSATQNLFSRLASQTAEIRGYRYPQEAENYAKFLLEEQRDFNVI